MEARYRKLVWPVPVWKYYLWFCAPLMGLFLLASSKSAGGWYSVLLMIENLSSHIYRFIGDIGMRAIERSYPRSRVGKLFYRPCMPSGINLWPQRCKWRKLRSWSSQSSKRAAKCKYGNFCTVKPVYNDHLMGYLSAFWSSSRWPRAT